MRGVLILIFTLFIVGCNEKGPEEKIRNVRTIELIQSQATSRHNFNGIARSEIAAQLSFNVSGTIERVFIRDGQSVKEGDIIATLDNSYFKLKVNEVKSSLKQAKIELSNSNSKYERIKQLYVNRSSSLSDLDNARTIKESANANYNTMKNRLEQAELKLSYTNLRAPMDGSISELKIQKGENITTAMSIASISSTKSIEVPISIPGSLIDYLKEGQTCMVTFDALKNKVYKAEVVEVSHASSQRTTTFPVVVRILEKSQKVHPGMSAAVRFDFQNENTKNSFVVPLHALMEDKKGHYLYIVENIISNVGKIKRCSVNRGELTSDGIIITSGVGSKMKVLTAGMSRVHEGQKVRVEI
jgi:RND family efflux transporter MFP subunit